MAFQEEENNVQPGGRRHHHTRNSAVTNFVAAGLTEGDAMKMTGHQTAHVFRHYDLGDVEALRARLAARRAYVRGPAGRAGRCGA